MMGRRRIWKSEKIKNASLVENIFFEKGASEYEKQIKQYIGRRKISLLMTEDIQRIQ